MVAPAAAEAAGGAEAGQLDFALELARQVEDLDLRAGRPCR